LKLISFDRLKPEKGINYCRDHLRRKVKADEFPEPIALSPGRIAWWLNSEIDDWLASRPRRHSGEPPPKTPGLGLATPPTPKGVRRGRPPGALISGSR
jgi:hypothetical protein